MLRRCPYIESESGEKEGLHTQRGKSYQLMYVDWSTNSPIERITENRVETGRDVVEFEGGEKVLDRTVKVMAILAGISLIWLMLLVCYSVFMRQVFNAPPLGGGDLASVSLVPVVFLGFAYCGWTGGHIAVDIISSLNKPNVTRWTDVTVRLLSSILLGILTWRCIVLYFDAAEAAEAGI